MSINKNYYVIAGFDLMGYATEKFEDWKWTEKGEEYLYRHHQGKIQLFDDPMGGEHLYLGYIIAAGDQYEFRSHAFTFDLVKLVDSDVMKKLIELTNIGVIDERALERCLYKVIVFEECT